MVSAGTASNTLTGITFSNSNGISIGLNAGTLTLSASNQTQGYYVTGNSTCPLLGHWTRVRKSSPRRVWCRSGFPTARLSSQAPRAPVLASGCPPGTQSISNGVVTFSNSNGVTFGPNAGVLTATVNPGPAAGIAAGAVAGTTQTTGSLVYSNSNGVSFGLVSGAGAGTITASVAVPSISVSAGTTSAAKRASPSRTPMASPGASMPEPSRPPLPRFRSPSQAPTVRSRTQRSAWGT